MPMFAPQLLLVLAVAAVGVLHTLVPDHWVPIALVARQRGWTRRQTTRAAIGAGTGHALSTLAIGIVVWVAGVAFAAKYGHYANLASSLALIGFGLWIALASIVELRGEPTHTDHRHDHDVLLAEAVGDEHGPAQTDDHDRNHHRGPEGPGAAGRPEVDRYVSRASPAAPPHTAIEQLANHRHIHRHEDGTTHAHLHAHNHEGTHDPGVHDEDPPLHAHEHKTSGRIALLLILGSSPMVEGIPAFFAAAKYGIGLIAVMSVVFSLTTIGTYVALCVYSAQKLQAVKIGPLERYGEVLSGAFIALVGVVFLLWPVL